MRHDMSGNSLIKIAQGVQRKGNRLLNGNTGGEITLSGKASNELLDLLEEGEEVNGLKSIYDDAVVDLINKLAYQGYLETDKERFFTSTGSPYLVNTMETNFFDFQRGNLGFDVDGNTSTIGLIGINSFSSSPTHFISFDSVSKIRQASSNATGLDISAEGTIKNTCGRFSEELNGILVKDYGDLEITIDQNLMENRLINLESDIFRNGRVTPLFIGGDHATTFYFIQGLLENVSDNIQILQLDAHMDTGNNRWGMVEHGSFVRTLANSSKVKKIVQLGVRGTYNINESKGLDGKVIQTTIDNLEKILEKDIPVYLTIDADAFDPSVIGAVSYPVLGGLGLTDFDSIALKLLSYNVVAADFVEFNGQYDSKNLIYSTAAAQVILGEIAILGGER